MYWWQLRYQYALHGLGFSVATTAPFAVLAALVLAGLVFIPFLFVELIALPIVFAIESIVRNRNARSRRGRHAQ